MRDQESSPKAHLIHVDHRDKKNGKKSKGKNVRSILTTPRAEPRPQITLNDPVARSGGEMRKTSREGGS